MRPVLLCALAAALGAQTTRPDSHAWSRALELRSPHYVVETDTFPEVARSLSDRLEETYFLFQDRFGLLTGNAGRRMRVALFRSGREYMTLGQGVQGAIGHFDSALDRCAIAWRGRDLASGWPIAIHEACHHYFRRRYPGLSVPSWYAEGIACYFEGLQDDTTRDHLSRLRVRSARQAWAQGEVRLEVLLRTRTRVSGGRLVLDHYKPARYYALAWSLVHFLATAPPYRQAFRRFELRLFHARPHAAERERLARRLLIEECGALAKIEQDWHSHLERMREPAPLKLAPVESFELNAERAWIRYAALRRLRGAPLAALREDVLRRLHDRDVIVRTAAARRLAKERGPRIVAAMTAALDAGDPELKRVALRALAHRGAEAAVPRLLKEQRDRRLALEALAAIGDPRAYPALRAGLLDRLLPPSTRARCASALGSDRAAALVLGAAADDRSAEVRRAAGAALLRLGPDQRLSGPARELEIVRRYIDPERLIALIERPAASALERIRACSLLGLGRIQRAVPALRRLCRSRVPERVRLEAVRSLVAITGKSRGFRSGQSAREREAALRRWAAKG